MRVLGIESSCDETGIAIYDDQQGILSHQLYSQVKLHADYGGVVPELASRDHVRKTLPLIQAALAESGCTAADIDGIAYTAGPGLVGALLVGATIGRSLALAWNKPAVAVHHMEGHLLAPMLEEHAPEFPFLALLVSGGHTQLMRVDGVAQYALLGETIDDAAGEAFDKSAKLLGLGYPGGPALARMAEFGDSRAFTLPRPLLHSGDLDFSFAGLKTAVLTQANKLGKDACDQARADLAASTQAAIVEVLVKKSLKALEITGLHRLVVAGGVGANRELRSQLQTACQKRGVRVHYPEMALCTDNGAMIALAAAMRLQAGLADMRHDYAFDVKPRWPLSDLNATPAPAPVTA